MQIMKAVLLCTMLIFVVSDTKWGKCPEVHYVLNAFDASKYIGKWYEIARSKAIPFESGDCIEAEYSILENGNLGVNNSQVIKGTRSFAVGEASPTTNPFQFKVDFGGFISKFFKGDYRVINTDYSGFSLVYSCSDFIFGRIEYVWVLSRTPQLDTKILADLFHYVDIHFGIKIDSLTYANQTSDFCKRKGN